MSDRPLVSIGLPVYNGAEFIGRALDSLLAQDYPNIELIISDNASTDATEEICRGYAKRDSRVRYHRNVINIGTSANFNQAFKMSKGAFFSWAGADDYRAETFVSQCLQALETKPLVVLSYPMAVEVDGDGREHTLMAKGLVDTTEALSAVWRFNAFMWGYVTGNPIYGLVRSEALRKTGLFRNIIAPDALLLGELSMLGSFALVPEPLLYRRVRTRDETWDQAIERWLADINPQGSKRPALFPYWRFAWALPFTVVRARINLGAKLLILPSAFLLLIGRHGYELVRDVRHVFKLVKARFLRRSQA